MRNCSSSTGLNVATICRSHDHRKRRSSWLKSFASNSLASSIHIRLTLETDLIFSGSSIPRKMMSDHVTRFRIYIGLLVISKCDSIHHRSITRQSSANIDSLIVAMTLRTARQRLSLRYVFMTSFCASAELFPLHPHPIKKIYLFFEWKRGIYFELKWSGLEKSAIIGEPILYNSKRK